MSRPKVMSVEVYTKIFERVREYCTEHDLDSVRFTFHGGEPMLMGLSKMRHLLSVAEEKLSGIDARFAIQTNAVLVNKDWADLFVEYSVAVGISIDGTENIHDENRVDHKGQGTFNRVIKGVKVLQKSNCETSALCVIPLGQSSQEVHQLMRNLEMRAVDYLFPDMSEKEHIAAINKYGRKPVFTFMKPIFESIIENDFRGPRVGVFDQITRLVMGGGSTRDTFGGGKQPYLFFESDGEYHGLDVLKSCAPDICASGQSVFTTSINEYVGGNSQPASILRGEMPLPKNCIGCDESMTCAGGYLPHRYRKSPNANLMGLFDNRSIWCEDILDLFQFVRTALAVNPTETRKRTLALNLLKQNNREYS